MGRGRRAAPGANGSGGASPRRPEGKLPRPPAPPVPRGPCCPSTCEAGGGVHPLEELPGAQFPSLVGVGREDGLAHADIAARRRPAPLHGAASEGRQRPPRLPGAQRGSAGPAWPLLCLPGLGRAGPAPKPRAEVESPPPAGAGPGLREAGKEPPG